MAERDSTTPGALGTLHEERARAYLERQGLRLVARNHRCRRGEIDLIMRERATLVFVEVRFRASERFGGALASVDARKQRRLVAAAGHYLQHHPTQAACRFDVLGIDGEGRIDWIRGAFDAM